MKIIFLERKYFTIFTHFYSKNKKITSQNLAQSCAYLFFLDKKAFVMYNSL